jgi:AbrB family looped-hinge helix DNA binding protein
MARDKRNASCGSAGKGGEDCCKVEAIVGVDERGQMVLPKEVRERAGINAGDKLAVTSWQRNGEVCCITLSRVDDLAEMVKVRLGPVMKGIL